MSEEAQRYYNLGMDKFEQGKFSEALGYFKKSSILENHFKTFDRIAVTLVKMGKHTEALDYSEKAFLLNENNDKVAINLSEILIKLENYERAFNIASIVLKRNPSYGPAKNIVSQSSAN